MKLLTLDIQNFKGIKALTVEPNGSDLSIYGENATGKTTIADAYTWLLTGKDSKGSAKFDVFPYNAPDGVDASVMGVFLNAAGERFTIQRIYRKVFERRNGEAQRKLKGNTTDYYINAVPKPLKEYAAFIEEQFGNEQKLMMLTDPDYFPGKLDYKERRDLLIKAFAPNYGDQEVITNHEELAPLNEYIGAMTTVTELAEQLKAQRKKINDRLNEIPGRIDENEKSRPEISEPDPAENIAALAKLRQEQQNKLLSLQSGLEASTLKRSISEIEANRAKAEQQYIREHFSGNEKLEQRIKALRNQLQQADSDVFRLERDLSTRSTLVSGLSGEINVLREQYNKVFGSSFDISLTVCPECGQALPTERVREMQEQFNLKKSENLERIQTQGKEKKGLLEKYTAQKEELTLQLNARKAEAEDIERLINELSQTAISPPDFSTTDEARVFDTQVDKLKKQLSDTELQLHEKISSAQAELDLTDRKLQAFRDREGFSKRNEEIDARIKELAAEEKKLGRELAQKENLLRLTDSFVKLQAGDITEKVNNAFKYVEWKLFDMQINGGTKPCCEAVVKGVPYTSNLNTAAKLNAGLDVINTLTAANSMDSLPVFIDNAESVTGFIPVNAQVIRLYVSLADKELRMEVLD